MRTTLIDFRDKPSNGAYTNRVNSDKQSAKCHMLFEFFTGQIYCLQIAIENAA